MKSIKVSFVTIISAICIAAMGEDPSLDKALDGVPVEKAFTSLSQESYKLDGVSYVEYQGNLKDALNVPFGDGIYSINAKKPVKIVLKKDGDGFKLHSVSAPLALNPRMSPETKAKIESFLREMKFPLEKAALLDDPKEARETLLDISSTLLLGDYNERILSRISFAPDICWHRLSPISKLDAESNRASGTRNGSTNENDDKK